MGPGLTKNWTHGFKKRQKLFMDFFRLLIFEYKGFRSTISWSHGMCKQDLPLHSHWKSLLPRHHQHADQAGLQKLEGQTRARGRCSQAPLSLHQQRLLSGTPDKALRLYLCKFKYLNVLVNRELFAQRFWVSVALGQKTLMKTQDLRQQNSVLNP